MRTHKVLVLFFLFVFFFFTTPAYTATLLSNIGTEIGGDFGGDPDSADRFSTGAAPLTITAVNLNWKSILPNTGVNQVGIYLEEDGLPGGTLVGSFFTNPNPTTVGLMTYTGKVVLEPNTTYWMLVDTTDGAEVAWTWDEGFEADPSTAGAAILPGSAFGNNLTVTWTSQLANLQYQIIGIAVGAPPENLTAAGSPDAVTLNWDPSAGASGYRVFRCTGIGTGTCGTAIAFTDDTSFEDEGGMLDTHYWYRVKACVSGRCSGFSEADEGFRGVFLQKLMRVNRFLSFDDDIKSDVLLRNSSNGRWRINFLNNRFVKATSGTTWLYPGSDWKMMGEGDFNGDGRGDVLLRNRVTGQWRIFLMDGRNYTSGKTLITKDLDWQMAGIGDFDGDGMADVVLRHRLTGRWRINFIDNRLIKPGSGTSWIYPGLAWEFMGTGDFDDDAISDIMLRHAETGAWRIFNMNGLTFTTGATPVTRDLDWQIAGIGDFDGDQMDDMLLRNTETGRWKISFLNNLKVKASSGPSWMFPSMDWEMMGTGDFNGSLRSDVLLRNKLTGGWWIFLMNGRSFTSGKTPITQNKEWGIPYE